MANPARGESRIRIGARDFTIAYDLNALCEVELLLDTPLTAIVERLVQPRMRDLRALLWAGLQRRHPMTVSDAGDLLGEVIRAGADATAALGEQLSEGIAAAFPPPTASPPATPAATTGKRSTRRPSKPASTPAAPGA